jgi:hypothetical protein
VSGSLFPTRLTELSTRQARIKTVTYPDLLIDPIRYQLLLEVLILYIVATPALYALLVCIRCQPSPTTDLVTKWFTGDYRSGDIELMESSMLRNSTVFKIL